MDKILLVVDMQNDFVTGSLGSKEAETIVSNVAKKISDFKGRILCTADTHSEKYLSTQEGKHLPVNHCIKNSEGWEIIPELKKILKEKQDEGIEVKIYEKPTFGSSDLAEFIGKIKDTISEIEIIGLCTDICVVSNALIVKAFAPEIPISVDASCCAGTTPEKHRAALETMRSCQIKIINEEKKLYET